MYLERGDIEARLALVAPTLGGGQSGGRRLPGADLDERRGGRLLGRLGEPFRSSFTAPQMRALLAQYEFEVIEDNDVPSLGAKLDPDLVRDLRRMRHARIVVASARNAA